MPEISLVTASYVTRELGFGALADWSQGDNATQKFFIRKNLSGAIRSLAG